MKRLLLVAATFALLAGACAGAVATQAQVAHTTAQVLNRAEPVWVRAMQDDATDAVNDVCPHDTGGCDAAPMRAAADAVFARWAPVVAAWEGVRIAHDAWRVQLERCRADAHASGCDGPSLDVLSTSLLTAATRWRCTVRDPAVHRPDLDPLPGTPSCPAAPATPDGGTPDAR